MVVIRCNSIEEVNSCADETILKGNSGLKSAVEQRFQIMTGKPEFKELVKAIRGKIYKDNSTNFEAIHATESIPSESTDNYNYVYASKIYGSNQPLTVAKFNPVDFGLPSHFEHELDFLIFAYGIYKAFGCNRVIIRYATSGYNPDLFCTDQDFFDYIINRYGWYVNYTSDAVPYNIESKYRDDNDMNFCFYYVGALRWKMYMKECRPRMFEYEEWLHGYGHSTSYSWNTLITKIEFHLTEPIPSDKKKLLWY